MIITNPILAYLDAEELGQVIGVFLCFGILVFSIVAIVKAFTRRTVSWIIAGSVGGVIWGGLFFMCFAGFVSGITSALRPAAERRDASTPKQSDAGASSSQAVTAASLHNDITLPIRVEARKMAELLKSCGLPADEANNIALNKMPGRTTVEWWESEFLPRFNAKQRSMLAKQLERYLDVARHSSERTKILDFAEEVSIVELQQELKLSDTECFDIWQAGLLNQTEDWWSRQIGSLSPEKQRKINGIRKFLASQALSAQQSEALRKQFLEFKDAAEQGHAAGQYNLGLSYYQGTGVKKDFTEAVKWYRKAAEQNVAEAQSSLGACYYSGEGVEKDFTEAVKWSRKAAEQGYAVAQFNLGVSYEYGEGVVKNSTEAVKWYRKAAEQGYADAQFNLGVCYRDGKGVEKDDNETVKWYRKAAEQGYADAQYNLGVCYHEGKRVEKDDKEAMKWYHKAAEQGYADAQFNLGCSYYMGNGVEKNYAEAYAWYNLASNTKKAAAESRDELEKAMSPQQVAAAQKRTKELGAQIESRLKSDGKSEERRRGRF